MADFGGKTAVVTGAASGIGRATAKALADAGATVWLLDVNDDAGESAAAVAGGTYTHLDVSDPEAWRAFYGTLDQLDLLHLNAGIYDIALTDITQISDARYRAYTGVNLDGVFFGLREAIPLLERTNGAVVVDVVDGRADAAPRQPALRRHQVGADRTGAQRARRARGRGASASTRCVRARWRRR